MLIREFIMGDVVSLKSTPKVSMTINKIIDKDRVGCAWFDEKNMLQYNEFNVGTLNLITESFGSNDGDLLLG